VIYTLSLHDALPILEIHIDRIELLQRHDRGAGAQISPGIDGDDAGTPRERSAQLLLGNIDLLLRHRGLLGLEIRGALVVIGLARSEEHTSELQSLAY